MTRHRLRISKTPTAWRWYLEDLDLPGDQTLDESGDHPNRTTAETEARATHPTVTQIDIHAVRGHGTAFEDSLPMIPFP
jgi:hypothetical protein